MRELVREDAAKLETAAIDRHVVAEGPERAPALADHVPNDEDGHRRAAPDAGTPCRPWPEVRAGATEVGPPETPIGAGGVERCRRSRPVCDREETFVDRDDVDRGLRREDRAGVGQSVLELGLARDGRAPFIAQDHDPKAKLLHRPPPGQGERELRQGEQAVEALPNQRSSLSERGSGDHVAGSVARSRPNHKGPRESRERARGYTGSMAQAPALPGGFELPLEPRLPRVGSVDQVAVEERAASLAKRSIKRDAKLFALDLVVRMTDLTTLEGADTPGKVAALSSKAVRPDPADPTVPSVAAVCVYPNLVCVALERVRGSDVKVASVATAFPSGQSPLDIKLADAARAAETGAEEIDMVIDRGAFLSGNYAKVYDEVRQVKDAIGDAHLKVILETGELGTYDNVRRASLLAVAGGADFIKTSTGKILPAATLPVVLVMLEAVRDVYEETGRRVGVKAAGGIRQAKQAVQHLVLVNETLGPEWLTPDLFRFGASSLLNDILLQIRKEKTGRYQSPDYFTLD